MASNQTLVYTIDIQTPNLGTAQSGVDQFRSSLEGLPTSASSASGALTGVEAASKGAGSEATAAATAHAGLSAEMRALSQEAAVSQTAIYGLGGGFQMAREASGIFRAEILGAESGLLAAGAAAGLAAAAIAIVGAEAIKAGAEWQESLTTLGIQAKLSEDQVVAVGQAMSDMVGKVAMSQEQLAGALANVAGRYTLYTGETLNAASATSLMSAAADLANSSGLGLDASTNALMNTMVAFKVPVEDASQVADILHNVMRDTGISADSLATAMDRLRARVGDVAPDLDQMGAIVESLAAHGESGSRGLMRVSSGIEQLADPTDKQQKLLDALGISFTRAADGSLDMRDVIDKLHPLFATLDDDQRKEISTTLAGSAAHVSMTNLIMDGTAAWDTHITSVHEAGTAQTDAQRATEDLNKKMAALHDEVNAFTAHIGGPLIDGLMSWADMMDKTVGPAVQRLAGMVSGLTGAIGSLMSGLGGLEQIDIGLIKTGFSIMSGQGVGEGVQTGDPEQALARWNASAAGIKAAQDALAGQLRSSQGGAGAHALMEAGGGSLAAPPEEETPPGEEYDPSGDLASAYGWYMDPRNPNGPNYKKPAATPKGRTGSTGSKDPGAAAGLMDYFQTSQADNASEMEKTGASLSDALNKGIADNTKANGEAAGRAVEAMVTALRTKGIPDWREQGDILAGAIDQALVDKTPESVAAAKELIQSMSNEIATATYMDTWAKDSTAAMDKVNSALDDTSTKITTTYANAGISIEKATDAFTKTSAIETANQAIADSVKLFQELQYQTDLATKRKDEFDKVQTTRGREDALTTENRAAQDADTAEQRRYRDANQEIQQAQSVQDLKMNQNNSLQDASEQHSDRLAQINKNTNEAQRKQQTEAENLNYQEAVERINQQSGRQSAALELRAQRQKAANDAADAEADKVRDGQRTKEDKDRTDKRKQEDDDRADTQKKEDTAHQHLIDNAKALDIFKRQLEDGFHVSKQQQEQDRFDQQIANIRTAADLQATTDNQHLLQTQLAADIALQSQLQTAQAANPTADVGSTLTDLAATIQELTDELDAAKANTAAAQAPGLAAYNAPLPVHPAIAAAAGITPPTPGAATPTVAASTTAAGGAATSGLPAAGAGAAAAGAAASTTVNLVLDGNTIATVVIDRLTGQAKQASTGGTLPGGTVRSLGPTG